MGEECPYPNVMKHFFRFLLVLSCVFWQRAEAGTFANQFIEFQLPEKWECKLDGTEWVCQSTDEQKKRDAIIVLAAKIKKAGMDELPIYKEHLQKKQSYTSLNGETVESQPRYVKDLDISGHQWVDALHLQSEIPDFYTRYLATVESDLGILVTFSVRKDKYDEYAPDIDSMVKSLRAFRKPGVINGADGANGAETPAPTDLFSATDTGKAVTKRKETDGNDAGAVLLLLLAVGGGGGFIIWKKRKR